MGDTLITIVVIIAAVGVILIFPLIVVSNSNDNIAQLTAETALEEFINEACTIGKATPENYDKLIQTLSGTGHLYTVELVVFILDENSTKKNAQAATDKIGQNLYIAYYDVEETLEEKGEYLLNEGWRLYGGLKNDDRTIYQMITGSTSQRITASYSALVTANGK